MRVYSWNRSDARNLSSTFTTLVSGDLLRQSLPRAKLVNDWLKIQREDRAWRR
jgi:hypothetical protein